MPYFLIVLLTSLLFGCQKTASKPIELATSIQIETPPDTISQALKKEVIRNTTAFDRTASYTRIKDKVTQGKPLVVHVLVPLCDNEHQGISPVNASLGNGFNPNSNLYWGAMYGIRSFFKRQKDWTSVAVQKPKDSFIMERIIFKKTDEQNTSVYLVADAYRGDKMHLCVSDFFAACSGKATETIQADGQSIGLKSEADLIVFNGHNGLMDYQFPPQTSQDHVRREACIIGCYSHMYFTEQLLGLETYPLLTTTGLMAPEAYVLQGLIEAWMRLDEGADIRKGAATKYHEYQKCGIRGATNLFKTGWK